MTNPTATLTKFLDRADQKPTLEEAQAFVGGYVEVLPNHGPLRYDEVAQILGNEEAYIHHLPVNPVASKYAGYEIRGNVLILRGAALWD
jgi:hypothetical protein